MTRNHAAETITKIYVSRQVTRKDITRIRNDTREGSNMRLVFHVNTALQEVLNSYCYKELKEWEDQ